MLSCIGELFLILLPIISDIEKHGERFTIFVVNYYNEEHEGAWICVWGEVFDITFVTRVA